MGESSTLASYAAADEGMSKVVERINHEMARLQETGAVIDPQTVRYGAATSDGSRIYFGSFVYTSGQVGDVPR